MWMEHRSGCSRMHKHRACLTRKTNPCVSTPVCGTPKIGLQGEDWWRLTGPMHLSSHHIGTSTPMLVSGRKVRCPVPQQKQSGGISTSTPAEQRSLIGSGRITWSMITARTRNASHKACLQNAPYLRRWEACPQNAPYLHRHGMERRNWLQHNRMSDIMIFKYYDLL